MKKIFYLSVIIVLILLKIPIILGTDLTEDETYYFMWSKYLDFSYFDHPPFVAYFIRFFTTFFGENEIGVRLSAFIPGIVFLFFVFLVLKELKVKEPLKGIYIFSLSLLFSIGGIVITPDTPLALFSIASFYFLLVSDRSKKFLYLAALFWGFSLLSKYIAVLLFPSFLYHFYKKKKLFSREFFVFISVAFFVFLPVLIWNFYHDFISFKFQLYHGYGKKEFKFLNIILFFRDGIFVLGFPLSIIIFIYGIKGVLKEGLNFLTISFLFPFLFFLLSFAFKKGEANWLMLPFIFLVIISVKYIKENRTFYYLSLFNFFTLVVIHIHAFYPFLKIKKDPTNRMRGWEELGYDFKWFADKYGIRSYAANTYQIASELSFYIEGKPYVFCLNINSRKNQFTIWQKQKKIPDTLIYAGNINAGFKRIFKEIVKIGESKTRYRKVELYILIK